MLQQFCDYLVKNNMAKSSINAYMYAVTSFLAQYHELTKENLEVYKAKLMENHKPRTVNLRIQGINKYLMFIRKSDLRLKSVKVHQRRFLENVISDADYQFLKNRLRNEENKVWYFAVWLLAATGARISELIQMKVEHVMAGYYDVYSKGGKVRRLYFPKKLQMEALEWLEMEGRKSGYMFLNHHGRAITTRGLSYRIKEKAIQYGMNGDVVYPHSFRHLFAKNFLEHHKDIALLADLLGHESIETTRIYLRLTASEQRLLIDDIVTW